MRPIPVAEPHRRVQRRQTPVAPSVAKEIDRQLKYLRRWVMKARVPVDPDDVMQEAWMAVIPAAAFYEPGRPGQTRYFFEIAKRAVGPMINRWISPVSLSRLAARRGVGSTLERVDVDAADGCCARTPTPELLVAVARAQRAHRLAVEDALGALPPIVRELGERSLDAGVAATVRTSRMKETTVRSADRQYRQALQTTIVLARDVFTLEMEAQDQ
jgi:DNA-directed RNA polymerase specialized sigma24 family protein